LPVLKAFPELTADGWPALLAQMEEKSGKRGKNLLAPFRAAITGKTRGPELPKILPLIGKERMIQRLNMALELS